MWAAGWAAWGLLMIITAATLGASGVAVCLFATALGAYLARKGG